MSKPKVEDVKSEKKPTEIRSKYFATVLYPESADLCTVIDRIASTGVCFAVSPLHDKDLEIDGKQKKPHYHILLNFKTAKTQNQILEFFKDLGCVGCEKVFDIQKYFEYLSHQNELLKYHYNPDDVQIYNGTALDFENGDSLLQDIIGMILDDNLCSMTDLFYRLKLYNGGNEFSRYLKEIKRNTYLLKTLCVENYNKLNK